MNRLGDATSPYLLQHKDNLVDWYEWGAEALTAAADQDRPIFLSISYAACHWCQVMNRTLGKLAFLVNMQVRGTMSHQITSASFAV